MPQLWQSSPESAKSKSKSTSVDALMEKHLASGSLQSWPPPRDLRYTQTQVGEAFVSLEHDLRKTILAEAEKNYQDFLDVYKREMNKATSTAFKRWEDLIKKWEDKLKTVDSSLSQLDVFKKIIREEAYDALRSEKQESLEAGKQELHQVVADSITTYVSELQDTLKQSTQALQQSTQALALTQKHLDTAVQELQRLQSNSGSNSNDPLRSNSNDSLAEDRIGSNSNNTLAEEHIGSTTNNINHSSHSNSHTPSYDTMPDTTNNDIMANTTSTTSVDNCTVEIGTTTPTCLPTTSTTETATMSNTTLAQLAQSA